VPCGRQSGRNAPLFSPYRRSIAEQADEPRVGKEQILKILVTGATGYLGAVGRTLAGSPMMAANAVEEARHQRRYAGRE
jgi:hypothetical protein